MVSFSRKSAVAEHDGDEAVAQAAPAPVVSASAPLVAFPRVNLIPAQIAQEARVLRAKQVLIGSVVASVAVVGGLYVMGTGQVSSAQDELDAATAQSATLAADATKYADAPKVKSDLQVAGTQQATAMAGEVRWSFVLNNIALTMPEGTSLASFSATISGSGAPASTGAAAAASSAVTSVLGQPGVGSIQFDGTALDNPHVAAFLESLARTPGLVDPFATQTTADQTSTAAVGVSTAPVKPKDVTFTGSVTIGPKALSHRYDVKGN